MATDPDSILARGTVTEDVWFDEIDHALKNYHQSWQGACEPGLNEMQIMVRMSFVETWRKVLWEHGITVCGEFGHA